jgi:V/A-type H+-transporting ATPase subunit I
MIVPMKKISLVVMEKSREDSLKKLREIGVVHLEKKNVTSEAVAKLLDRKAKAENAAGVLRTYAAGKKAPGQAESSAAPHRREGDPLPRRRAGDFVNGEGIPFSTEAVDLPERPDLVTFVLELAEERKQLQDKAAALSKERSRIEEWGSFEPGDFAFLAEKGVQLYPYKIAQKDFGSLPEDLTYIRLGEDKASVYILAVNGEIPGGTPFVPGEYSLMEVDRLIAGNNGQAAGVEKRLASLAGRKSAIEEEEKNLLRQIEFETARAGMDKLEDVPVESAVAWISGFVPRDDLGLVKRAAAENGWALVADDPGPEDEVPTKLKNNKLVNLIVPITDFLEVTPGYHEADISGWFLLFFCIFFGMIFGDAGYGFLLFLIGVIGVLKTAKKGVPVVIKTLLLLSASNIVWGVLTCTWFGIEPLKLPGFFQSISLPLISGAKSAESPAAKAIVDQNLMIFCFFLALLQLSIGHVVGIIQNLKAKSLKFLADAGNIFMLAGMFDVVLALVVSNDYRRIPFLPVCIYLIAAGFVLNFVFANYEGSIGKSIVESLKNIISVILGITNVFSDIMSYIRLWAVGLAGASISSTVNTLAGPLLGNFLVFLGILLLVFGHGLNIVLNVLSVLVHGVRLNTLEFSSHVGLAWSGMAYKPFSDKGKGGS